MQWNITQPWKESTDTCYDVDGPQKYDATWKKSDTKGHMLYDPIYMNYPKQVNP